MDSIYDKYNEITGQINSIIERNRLNQGLKIKLESEKEKLLKQREELVNQIDLYKKAISVLQKISDDRSEAAKQIIEDLINSALKSIILDQDYRIKIDEYTMGSSLMMRLVMVDEAGNEISLLNGCGGGIQQIVSFLMLISLIAFTKSSRVVWLDEVFSGLAPENAAIVSDILNTLATKNNFQIILVEQKINLWMNDNVTLIRMAKDRDKGLYIEAINDKRIPEPIEIN